MRSTPGLLLFFLLFAGGESSQYLGCYSDPSTTARLLPDIKQNFKGTLTIETCLNFCQEKGYRYAGVEWRSECFCSNDRPTFKYVTEETECNLQCDGNPEQNCGGNLRINVYDFQDSGENAVANHALGCYKDSQDRMFKGAREDSDNQTPEHCVGFCFRKGYRLAGVQFGKECFCGDYLKPSKAGINKCSTSCTGNASLKCGGPFFMNVYLTSISDNPHEDNYLGCFQDNTNNIRLLSAVKLNLKETNTPRRCMNMCLINGFKYSGTQYGSECFCGNKKPPSDKEVSESECHKPCPGNKAEYCGGSWRLQAYSTGSGTVVPLFPERAGTQRPVAPTAATVGVARPIRTTVSGNTIRTTPRPTKKCNPSSTMVNGKSVCQNQLLFKEEFNGQKLDTQKWTQDILMPWIPDYEFVTYADKPQNLHTFKGTLYIKPTLLDDDFVRHGKINLQNCTGKQYSEECERHAATYSILPPVESARITTKDFFSFRYGIVQIRAKLPVGDWIIPEIWLEPKRRSYGVAYASGRMRIAMARGNRNLVTGANDIGISHLESGILMGVGENIRGRTIVRTKEGGWNDDFHNFTLIWTPENLSFMVDGEYEEYLVPADGGIMCDLVGFDSEECETWKDGSRIAPFDKEFYISLGLTVGGMRDFPDDSLSQNVRKPWRNKNVKAMANFWKGKDNWLPTWDEQGSALQIDTVKVLAL